MNKIIFEEKLSELKKREIVILVNNKKGENNDGIRKTNGSYEIPVQWIIKTSFNN